MGFMDFNIIDVKLVIYYENYTDISQNPQD